MSAPLAPAAAATAAAFGFVSPPPNDDGLVVPKLDGLVEPAPPLPVGFGAPVTGGPTLPAHAPVTTDVPTDANRALACAASASGNGCIPAGRFFCPSPVTYWRYEVRSCCELLRNVQVSSSTSGSAGTSVYST